jgi:hypothetical protein
VRKVTKMDEVDVFLSAVLPRQREAEIAILNGDPGPRKLLWSHNDPVTVLSADRKTCVSRSWRQDTLAANSDTRIG